MGNNAATLIGTLAILMWAMLAPLTTLAQGVPPIELLALTFGTAFITGSAWLLATGGPQAFAVFRQDAAYWIVATAALFLYHALYFVALNLAPPAQASLIAYLWPLLIVLLSSAIGGFRLSFEHVAGALLGLGGTAILILSGAQSMEMRPYTIAGWLAALGCAVIWSSYSVVNRRFEQVPSQVMVGVCGIVALLGAATHLIFEAGTVMPNTTQWAAILCLGIGPVGLAFLAWDHGTKRGNVPLLGTLSYAAPVLSTIILVVLGRADATPGLFVACAAVVGGGWLASRAKIVMVSRA